MMKNIYTSIVFTCIAILSISCNDFSSSDDEIITSDSYLKVQGGVTQNLKSATYKPHEEVPSENGFNESYLNFYTTKLTQKEGNIIPENSVFSRISFQIVSNSYGNIPSGTYSHNDKSYSEPRAFSYFGSGYVIGSDDTFNDAQTFSSGNMTVSKNGDIYEIYFDGVTTDGTKFTFEYTGDMILE